MSIELAYYPGCSLHGMAKEYDASTRAICKDLGIKLTELDGWNCCGSSSAHAQSHLLSLALPARNLALAERAGHDVVAPCAACYSHLLAARQAVVSGGSLAQDVIQAAGLPLNGASRVLSLPEVLAELPEGTIAKHVKAPLSHLKVACYYGCLLVRPGGKGIDDPEHPVVLDSIMQQIGASTVEWSHKTDCCGAFLSVPRTDVVARLAANILASAKSSGANCLAVACPMCQSNLDMRQEAAQHIAGEKFGLPVFYFTQLMGVAFGHTPETLGLNKHLVDGQPLLKGGAA
jgi:heterodisulfide reductase subunit B